MIEFVTSNLAKLGSFFTLDLIFLVFLFTITLFALVELALRIAGVQGSILFESLKTLKTLRDRGDANFLTLRARFVTFPERIRRAYNHYLDNMSLVPSRFLSPQLIHCELEKNVLFPNALKFLCFSLSLVFSLLALSIESITSLHALKSISFFLVAVTFFYFGFSAIKSGFDKLCEKSFLSMVKQLDFFSYLKMPYFSTATFPKNTGPSQGNQQNLKDNFEKAQPSLSSSQLSLLISQSETNEKAVANDIAREVSGEILKKTYEFEKDNENTPLSPLENKSSEASSSNETCKNLVSSENSDFKSEPSFEKTSFKNIFSKDVSCIKRCSHLNLLKKEAKILSPEKEPASLSSQGDSSAETTEKVAKLSSAFDQILSSDTSSLSNVKALENELSWQDAKLYAKAKEIFKLGDKTALSNFEENTKKLLGLNETTSATTVMETENPSAISKPTILQSLSETDEVEQPKTLSDADNFCEKDLSANQELNELSQSHYLQEEELANDQTFQQPQDELTQPLDQVQSDTTFSLPLENEENESTSLWKEKTEEEIVEELIQSEIDNCKDGDEEIYAKTKEFLASQGNYQSFEPRNYFGQ